MPPRAPKMDKESAAAIALQVVSFLASDEDRLSRFLSLTGTGPGELRHSLAEESFQAAVLDYLMQDESLLLVFCAEHGVDPLVMFPAQQLLSGGDFE
jgi:hypothetical protein